MTPLDRKPRYELEELGKRYGVDSPAKLTRYELIDALKHKGYRDPETGGSRRFARRLFDFASDVAKTWATLPPPALLSEIGDEISKRVSEWPSRITGRPDSSESSSFSSPGAPQVTVAPPGRTPTAATLGASQPRVPQTPATSPKTEPKVEEATIVKDEVTFDEPLPTKTMGRLLAGQGHTERAIAIFESLIKAKPNDVGLQEELRVLKKKESERKATRIRIQSVDLESVLVSWRAKGELTLRVKEVNPEGSSRSVDFEVPESGSRVVSGMGRGSICSAELWQEGKLLLSSDPREHR